MMIQSPMEQLAAAIHRDIKAAELAHSRKVFEARKRAVRAAMSERYFNSRHWFQLIENGKEHGEPVVMLGAEASEQNRIFNEKFRADINAAIDAGKPFGQTGAINRHWKRIGPVENGEEASA